MNRRGEKREFLGMIMMMIESEKEEGRYSNCYVTFDCSEIKFKFGKWERTFMVLMRIRTRKSEEWNN